MTTPAERGEPKPSKHKVGIPEGWARVEEALGFKDLDPQRRERLGLSIRQIFREYFDPDEPPDLRRADFTDALDNLKEHAQRLRRLLSPPDDLFDEFGGALGFDEAMQWAEAGLLARLQILPDANRETLREALAELIAAVDTARSQLGSEKGGNPKDWRLRGAIGELAGVYFDNTGKRPGVSRTNGVPGGPFLRFVKAAFDVFLPWRLKGDEALTKLIRSVVKERGPRAEQGN
jgi:hypothetical protein